MRRRESEPVKGTKEVTKKRGGEDRSPAKSQVKRACVREGE